MRRQFIKKTRQYVSFLENLQPNIDKWKTISYQQQTYCLVIPRIGYIHTRTRWNVCVELGPWYVLASCVVFSKEPIHHVPIDDEMTHIHTLVGNRQIRSTSSRVNSFVSVTKPTMRLGKLGCPTHNLLFSIAATWQPQERDCVSSLMNETEEEGFSETRTIISYCVYRETVLTYAYTDW